jgi:hypothetical protein
LKIRMLRCLQIRMFRKMLLMLKLLNPKIESFKVHPSVFKQGRNLIL